MQKQVQIYRHKLQYHVQLMASHFVWSSDDLCSNNFFY